MIASGPSSPHNDTDRIEARERNTTSGNDQWSVRALSVLSCGYMIGAQVDFFQVVDSTFYSVLSYHISVGSASYLIYSDAVLVGAPRDPKPSLPSAFSAPVAA
jgi:hypothetical protein